MHKDLLSLYLGWARELANEGEGRQAFLPVAAAAGGRNQYVLTVKRRGTRLGNPTTILLE